MRAGGARKDHGHPLPKTAQARVGSVHREQVCLPWLGLESDKQEKHRAVGEEIWLLEGKLQACTQSSTQS